ncbi:hypothetical protein [uncultured Microbacterium sp.]|uniref:hypothetical protein n=1 Tax=uncultured Microbacterium sp. TaxID=191216 RepID=UPI002608766E|nr:hypothetical protein [uncultured Microbacterium sp.]
MPPRSRHSPVARSDAAPRPVPGAVLAAQGISAWMGPASLPLWIDDPEWRFFATADSSAATRAGLRTRPLAETLADALAFENQRTGPRPAGLSDDEQRALRASLAASSRAQLRGATGKSG